jgi:signal transduction histidine kinase
VPLWVIIVAVVCSLLIIFLVVLLIQLQRSRVTLDDFKLDSPDEQAVGFGYENKFNVCKKIDLIVCLL